MLIWRAAGPLGVSHKRADRLRERVSSQKDGDSRAGSIASSAHSAQAGLQGCNREAVSGAGSPLRGEGEIRSGFARYVITGASAGIGGRWRNFCAQRPRGAGRAPREDVCGAGPIEVAATGAPRPIVIAAICS